MCLISELLINYATSWAELGLTQAETVSLIPANQNVVEADCFLWRGLSVHSNCRPSIVTRWDWRWDLAGSVCGWQAGAGSRLTETCQSARLQHFVHHLSPIILIVWLSAVIVRSNLGFNDFHKWSDSNLPYFVHLGKGVISCTLLDFYHHLFNDQIGYFNDLWHFAVWCVYQIRLTFD